MYEVCLPWYLGPPGHWLVGTVEADTRVYAPSTSAHRGLWDGLVSQLPYFHVNYPQLLVRMWIKR